MSRRLRSVLLAFAVLAPLGACSSVSEAVHGPQLAPTGYPVSPKQQELATAQANAIAGPASANSLWRVNARTFFSDQRAQRVGDILTVLIEIDDNAQTNNTTTAGRTTSLDGGIPHVLGFEQSLGKILPPAYDPTNAFSTSTKSSNVGAGGVTRSEKINLTVAAVVTAVLPNGNLVIEGTQEVRTNAEVRQLTVAGVVRPEDISSTNTIRHTQIAEARINYGGRGDISSVQKTPTGQALVERFWPF
jgi:flagellar L-ring protein precursor FlgH